MKTPEKSRPPTEYGRVRRTALSLIIGQFTANITANGNENLLRRCVHTAYVCETETHMRQWRALNEESLSLTNLSKHLLAYVLLKIIVRATLT